MDTTNTTALCNLAATPGKGDWSQSIRALEALYNLEHDCVESESTADRLYLAYITFAKELEISGQQSEATELYQSAHRFRPEGTEAVAALVRLTLLAPTPEQRCDSTEIRAALASVPLYRAGQGSFVRVAGTSFIRDGQHFPVYGINYYPRDTPWRRFLSETRPTALEVEFPLLVDAGINVLRVQVRHDLLFQCRGSTIVPVAQNLTRLDTIIRTASKYGLRLVMVLNDAPDLTSLPLYTTPQSVSEMVYLAARYRDEPTILAWDLRDSGDQDYLSGRFDKRTVLEWLAAAAIAMRQADPNHLLTASWGPEAATTIPSVDFVSFEAQGDLEKLRQQIALLRAATDKPLFMSAIGFHTFGQSEEGQRDALQAALDAAAKNGLAGWAIWTAFDFPLTVTCYQPDCINQDSPDHHYGLWTTDYVPKLAVTAIRLATGTAAPLSFSQ